MREISAATAATGRLLTHTVRTAAATVGDVGVPISASETGRTDRAALLVARVARAILDVGATRAAAISVIQRETAAATARLPDGASVRAGEACAIEGPRPAAGVTTTAMTIVAIAVSARGLTTRRHRRIATRKQTRLTIPSTCAAIADSGGTRAAGRVAFLAAPPTIRDAGRDVDALLVSLCRRTDAVRRAAPERAHPRHAVVLRGTYGIAPATMPRVAREIHAVATTLRLAIFTGDVACAVRAFVRNVHPQALAPANQHDQRDRKTPPHSLVMPPFRALAHPAPIG